MSNIFSSKKDLIKPPSKVLQDKIDQNPSQKKKLVRSGINGEYITEEVPQYVTTESEVVYQNSHNSYIVLGRDRPASRASGYGGAGATSCGSIDLVVGRQGKSDRYVDPNFKTDSARIYLSQKTNIDENFELTKGTLEQEGKSGIGLKADGVRIIARENVKIVTGPFPRESDTNQTQQFSRFGVDIIAGNDDSNLQPMALGENLVRCLAEIVQSIESVSLMLDKLAASQKFLESSIASHSHTLSIGNLGLPLAIQPDVQLLARNAAKSIKQLNYVDSPMFSHRSNITNLKTNYLDPAGDSYICSPFNKVN